MQETLAGIIDRVTFHNPDNGFCVLRVQEDGKRDTVIVVGTLASAVAGEYITARGRWVQEKDYGLQFKADDLRTTPPHTAEGIERYLASGLIKGIGKHYAKKIVDVFGQRTLDIIDASPVYLKEIKGIGPTRIQRIRESWREQKNVRAIMLFLQAHGVGGTRATRIYKTYGDQAIETVKANPYRLAEDIWGVGFQTADQLAQRLGIDRASPFRARAALRYVLQQLSQEGHVGYPEAEVVHKTGELTGIDEDILREAVEQERSEENVIREPWTRGDDRDPWLYLKPLFLAETGIARLLKQQCEGNHPLPDLNAKQELAQVETSMGLMLAPSQRQAIEHALRQKVLVLTGGPGTGKTTIVRGILETFARQGLSFALCAPTGRAAKRLSETTGHEAKTIHRLLEFEPGRGGFKRNRERPLDVDLLVVDEASMLDTSLAHKLLQALPEKACLLLVGDVDQLPSVGPGTVLADIIASPAVPVARLTEIFRQAEQSLIVRAAHRVNHGELPESAPADKLGDFYVVRAETPEEVRAKLVTLIRDRIPARFGLDPLRDVQVLTPMNRSELGARALNQELQAVLNPPGPGLQLQRFGWTYRAGDKVMQTVNNYDKEVFNGDIGRVLELDEEEQEAILDFDGRKVNYDFNELDEVSLAYAVTVHKAQGSEYPAVVVPLHTQHFLMLQRNLLYTAITRGKKLVVLVGSEKALSLAVQRQDTRRRCTGLEWRLRQ